MRRTFIKPIVDSNKRKKAKVMKAAISEINSIHADVDYDAVELAYQLERGCDPIPLPLASPSTIRMYVGEDHYSCRVDDEWLQIQAV